MGKLNRYQELKALGKDLHKYMALGFVPSKLIDWLFIYEKYIEYKKNNDPENKKTIRTIALEVDISIRHTYRIIDFMESN